MRTRRGVRRETARRSIAAVLMVLPHTFCGACLCCRGDRVVVSSPSANHSASLVLRQSSLLFVCVCAWSNYFRAVLMRFESIRYVCTFILAQALRFRHAEDTESIYF
jgi:hypothetical protein